VAALLEVDQVKKHFEIARAFSLRKRPPVRAVDGVTFSIARGETFGLVGESGSGKTTVARLCLRLLEPTAGTIRFMGDDLFKADGPRARALGKEIGAVFQDPYAALNPRKRVKDIVALPFRLHTDLDERAVAGEVVRLLESVSLVPADRFLARYPHELSGGQRQRIVIARAIALRPQLVVADEPVSALDLSIRAQILKILIQLRADYHLTYLYITHDLGVVRSLCDTVAVMYLGKIAELAPVDDLYAEPLHPYTQLLLLASPIPHPTRARARARKIIKGEVPSPANPPSGCRFHPRCPFAMPRCAIEEPALREAGSRLVACHLYDSEQGGPHER
jgi:oligopeptide/dipeptide ABC transporter ATP-binding protein